MSSTINDRSGPAALGPEAHDVMLAARATSAADRLALAEAIKAARHVKAQPRNRLPRRFTWWVLGAGSGIGFLVIGGVALAHHPASDSSRATSACEQAAGAQLNALAPPQFADVRARRTGPRSYSINGTVSSVDSFGVQTVWTCAASSDGSAWIASVNLL